MAEVLPLNYTRMIIEKVPYFILRNHAPASYRLFDDACALRQLEANSVDASLVAEVLPLNYTRMIIEKVLYFILRNHAPASYRLFDNACASGQLEANSVDASLVAGVLPLNYTRTT
ncbi:hypothetical protein DX933_00155 [Ornithinibacillus gellani]|uniref:hypothetical protein n=1 Tax=Ornithinibacillus gellani TaxID=2293253 RepID=UPI000F4798E7|nr:hypothetical protein [Ornithinibacillus gellani]TQS76559.1 hypothetical protein DX933_00155 [Ornithinibacillus gellani]